MQKLLISPECLTTHRQFGISIMRFSVDSALYIDFLHTSLPLVDGCIAGRAQNYSYSWLKWSLRRFCIETKTTRMIETTSTFFFNPSKVLLLGKKRKIRSCILSFQNVEDFLVIQKRIMFHSWKCKSICS